MWRRNGRGAIAAENVPTERSGLLRLSSCKKKQSDPVGTRTRDLRINLPHELSLAEYSLRSGLYHLPRTVKFAWGATRQVSEEPALDRVDRSGFLLITQSGGFSRRECLVSRRTDGSQGVPAYGAVLLRDSRPEHSYFGVKSVALPTELPGRPFIRDEANLDRDEAGAKNRLIPRARPSIVRISRRDAMPPATGVSQGLRSILLPSGEGGALQGG